MKSTAKISVQRQISGNVKSDCGNAIPCWWTVFCLDDIISVSKQVKEDT